MKKLWYDRKKKNEQGMSTPYGAVKSKGAESPLHRNKIIMKHTIFIFLLSFITFLTSYGSLHAQSLIHQGSMECQPTYGHYWRSDKWGWYGARKVVHNPVEAREILEKFFMPNSGIKVGKIRVTNRFFEADIINRNGIRIDLVIIDKRTGRIRSIY